jgi:hypothetical protein
MTVKEEGEIKSPQWLRFIHNFFLDASIRIKQLFNRSRRSLPDTGTGNNEQIQTPGTSEQKTVAYDSPYLLILPPGIRNKFVTLANESREVSTPLLNHAGNHSTAALLNINNVYFWGINNVALALTPQDLHDLKAIFKNENSLSTYAPFVVHPETDAILKAFKQKITADRATMFVYRKQCNICAGREFNSTHLRRLLPILSLKELTLYTTNSLGKFTKLVLSPFPSNVSHHHSAIM